MNICFCSALKGLLMANQIRRAKGEGYSKWPPHGPNLPTAAIFYHSPESSLHRRIGSAQDAWLQWSRVFPSCHMTMSIRRRYPTKHFTISDPQDIELIDGIFVGQQTLLPPDRFVRSFRAWKSGQSPIFVHFQNFDPPISRLINWEWIGRARHGNNGV